jgi:hypothetical protein
MLLLLTDENKKNVLNGSQIGQTEKKVALLEEYEKRIVILKAKLSSSIIYSSRNSGLIYVKNIDNYSLIRTTNK